ncbi:hypothetical protein ACWD5R_12990 [Streptomyces sp. NPDC002514]|uniref:hypothetical protein n=1 Tax=unclassified Streptomyces TaxID=2593676 RepID=UPI0036A4628A
MPTPEPELQIDPRILEWRRSDAFELELKMQRGDYTREEVEEIHRNDMYVIQKYHDEIVSLLPHVDVAVAMDEVGYYYQNYRDARRPIIRYLEAGNGEPPRINLPPAFAPGGTPPPYIEEPAQDPAAVRPPAYPVAQAANADVARVAALGQEGRVSPRRSPRIAALQAARNARGSTQGGSPGTPGRR